MARRAAGGLWQPAVGPWYLGRVLNSREKTYAAAQKFQQKGQLDKAIAELERLVQEDPADVRTLLKIGDLHVRHQDNVAAVKTYIQVARTYQAQGFSLKAVAVYKQVVHLEPGNSQVVAELAALYEQLSLVSDAVAQLHHLLALHKGAQAWAEAAQVLRKLMALAGETQDLLLQWAEVHGELKDMGEVKRTLTRVAEACLAQGRLDDWAQVGEDLLQADPELGGLACELAKHYMGRDQPKQALLKLQVAFRAAPQDTETLTLLAQVFEALGQVPKAIAVLHELGGQAQQRGQTLALERIATHILKLDDADRLALAWVAPAGVAKATAARQQSRPQAPPPPPMGGAAVAGRAASAPDGPIDLTNLLIEASVFARYGLVVRAQEYLARVLSAFPEHPEALALQARLQAKGHDNAAAADARDQAPRQASPETATDAQDKEAAPSDAGRAMPEPENHSFTGPTQVLQEPFAFDAQAPPHEAVEGFKTDSTVPLHTAGDGSGDEPFIMLELDDGSVEQSLAALSLDELIAEEVPDAQDAPRGATRLDAHFDAVLMHADGGEAIKPVTQTVDASDYDTQFNLGIAYKEMGLFPDALKQFQRLLHAPGYTVSARAILATCLQESGQHEAAHKMLLEALALTEATPKERAALYYDVAVGHLALGREDEARQAFAQAADIEPQFRDVAQRLEHPHLQGA